MSEFTPWFASTNKIDLLDEFIRDYLTALEWTDCNRDHDGEEGPSFEDATAFAPSLIERAKEDCAAFQQANAADLAAYAEQTGYSGGNDFWLTRNGHGAGFWDRGLGELGDRLTSASKPYGTVDVYVGDDLLIYC